MPETIESDAYNLTFRWVASKEIRDIKPGFEIGPFWSTPVKKWGKRRKRYWTVQRPVFMQVQVKYKDSTLARWLHWCFFSCLKLFTFTSPLSLHCALNHRNIQKHNHRGHASKRACWQASGQERLLHHREFLKIKKHLWNAWAWA